MKKRKIGDYIILAVVVFCVLFAAFKFITVGFKKAVKIQMAPGVVALKDYVGHEVKLLCGAVEATGSSYQAFAIETSENVYTLIFTPKDNNYVGEFDRSTMPRSGPLIEHKNIGPALFMAEDLFDYVANYYILKGTLAVNQYTETYYEHCIIVEDWDIVYPIRDGLKDSRLEIFQGRLTPFDFRWGIGYIFG